MEALPSGPGLDLSGSATLKLHVDRHGQVWELAGHGLPRPSGLNVHTYGLRLGQAWGEGRPVRLIGCARNLPLVLALGALQEGLGVVQLASPRLVPGRSGRVGRPRRPRGDWAEVMNSLHALRCAESTGLTTGQGWYRLDQATLASYRLTLAVRQRQGLEPPPDSGSESGSEPGSEPGPEPEPSATDRLLGRLLLHPSYAGLSFLRPLRPLAWGSAMALVLDPRYFLDPYRDDPLGRLYRFFGVCPRIYRSLLGQGDRPEGSSCAAHVDRLDLLLRCWTMNARDVVPPEGPERCRWFLAQSAPDTLDDRHQALVLAGCRRFLDYAVGHWLEALARVPPGLVPGSPPGRREPLFDPGCYLVRRSLIQAYQAHRAGHLAA